MVRLRINLIIKLDNDNTVSQKYAMLLKTSISFLVISIIIAYSLSIVRMSYTCSTIIYHIIYMVAIVAVLAIIVLAVVYLAQNGTLNRNEGKTLFVIYFAVLSVSSFFSYNAFISVLYPNQVRNIDVFQTYKLGTIALAESIDADIDRDYYDELYTMINIELQKIMTSDKMLILSDEERNIYENREQYEKYLRTQEEIEKQNAERDRVEQWWDKFEKDWKEANKDIGVNAKEVWITAYNDYQKNLGEIESNISNLKKNRKL